MECLPKKSPPKERPTRLVIDLIEEWADRIPPDFRRQLLVLLDQAHVQSRESLRRIRIENDAEEGAFRG